MLDKSWLSEALGTDTDLSEPVQANETASICSVVQGFLHNDPRLSRQDVAQFINEALQNEASDLWRQRAEGVATAEAWQGIADRALSDLDPVGATESEQKRDAMIQAVADRYTLGRTDFGEAVYIAQRSKKVALSPETCAWVVTLDHDKHLTDSIGLDVDEVFGSNVTFEPSTEARPAARRAHTVDFSREATPAKAAEHEAKQSPATARRSRTTFREPRRAGDSVSKLVASLKQYDPIEESVSAQHSVAEPEVA